MKAMSAVEVAQHEVKGHRYLNDYIPCVLATGRSRPHLQLDSQVKGGGILVIDVSGPHLVGLWPSDDVGGWPMAHQARSCLVVHYRVLEVALAVDREMVPRRFAHRDQEETQQPRADDPDERDKLDGSKTWWPSAHLLESLKPEEVLQSDLSAVLLHRVEWQDVFRIHGTLLQRSQVVGFFQTKVLL